MWYMAVRVPVGVVRDSEAGTHTELLVVLIYTMLVSFLVTFLVVRQVAVRY